MIWNKVTKIIPLITFKSNKNKSYNKVPKIV